MRTTLKKRAPRAKKSAPKQVRAQPLLEGQLPADMRPSFCSFVRHMLQSTAARLVTSNMVTKGELTKFVELVGSLDWNGSNEEAKKAIEGTLSFLSRLQRDHEEAGDGPFSDKKDKELFFKNIHFARTYLNKVLSMLVGGPHILVQEEISLNRLLGDTVPLVKANGLPRDECRLDPIAAFTVTEMARFTRRNPDHPVTKLVMQSNMTLNEFAARVQEERGAARARNSFDVDYAHGTGMDVLKVDQIELFLLMENMLTNAKRAGATEVKITSKRSLLNPRMAEISVEDNGKGFTPSQLKKARLGEPFSTKRRGNGEVNGVGLAHCRSIVGQYGGEFSIESRKGKGAAITLTLPLSRQG